MGGSGAGLLECYRDIYPKGLGGERPGRLSVLERVRGRDLNLVSPECIPRVILPSQKECGRTWPLPEIIY